MIYKERTNISPLFLRALKQSNELYFEELKEFLNSYPEEFDYQISTTTLSSAPRPKVLQKRHSSKIVVDPLHFFYSLWGNGIHYFLEQNADESKGEMKETRLGKVLVINGVKVLIHGQFDWYSPEGGGVIEDHKLTGTYTMQKERTEHEAQLNVLYWLCRYNNIPVKYIRNNYMFRDWSAKYLGQPGYPKEQVVLEDKNIWPKKKIDEYILDRAKVHLNDKDKADDQLTECTPEEQWESPIKYGGYKIQPDGSIGTRAYRVKETEQELLTALGKNAANYKIIQRGGYKTKCQKYCLVKDFCSQYKPQNENDEDE